MVKWLTCDRDPISGCVYTANLLCRTFSWSFASFYVHRIICACTVIIIRMRIIVRDISTLMLRAASLKPVLYKSVTAVFRSAARRDGDGGKRGCERGTETAAALVGSLSFHFPPPSSDPIPTPQGGEIPAPEPGRPDLAQRHS